MFALSNGLAAMVQNRGSGPCQIGFTNIGDSDIVLQKNISVTLM